MRSTAPPSGLPAISPTRGEISCRIRFRQFPAPQNGARPRSCQSPPLRGR
ncbi:MAG: alpha/beta hydrolase, partial [Mesorhizobium sp.]